MTDAELSDFAAAWGAKDIDRVMSHFADNAVFSMGAGPEPGLTIRGKDAIRDSLAAQFDGSPPFEEWDTSGYVDGSRGALRWRFRTGPERTLIVGCDLLEFDAGKIVLKDAYRKVAT